MGLHDLTPFINIRRNHGFEHATIHVLSETMPQLSVVGRSDMGGFTLYGNISTDAVIAASDEALKRLRNGQAELAVHPRCGTILATTGIFTGIAAFLAISLGGNPKKRFRWGTLPQAVTAATFAALASQPLGLIFQERYTVTGNPGNLAVVNVSRSQNGGMVVHRVKTRQ